MAFTSEKVEQLLAELEKKQGIAMYAKDFDALALHYHPDAVFVHRGVGAYYGREAIKKALSDFLGDKPDVTGSDNQKFYASATFDGSYLIRRGAFKFGDSPKDYPFEQIYKKVDGEYFIYFDSFEYSP